VLWPALLWPQRYGPLCRPQADAMDGAPSKFEGATAPYVGRRPTRWMVLPANSKAYGPLCRPQADAMDGVPGKFEES